MTTIPQEIAPGTAHPRDHAHQPASRPAVQSPQYRGVFPNSTKVYLEGPHGVRVPMREIALSGGEPPLRVYDTSGPQGFDVREGLPPLRGEWIRALDVEESRVTSHESQHPKPDSRLATRDQGRANLIPNTLRRPVLRGRSPITQLHSARRGLLSPEMEFIALREGMPAEFVRSEVARGRAIIPANIN